MTRRPCPAARLAAASDRAECIAEEARRRLAIAPRGKKLQRQVEAFKATTAALQASNRLRAEGRA